MTAAFSNGFEYDAWTANWCHRCTKDETGTAPDGVYCEILNLALCGGEVPPEWSPGTDDLRDRYHCSEFEQ